jgi:hypothetical protein
MSEENKYKLLYGYPVSWATFKLAVSRKRRRLIDKPKRVSGGRKMIRNMEGFAFYVVICL